MKRILTQVATRAAGAVAWGDMLSVPGHNKYDLAHAIKQLRPAYAEASASGGHDIMEWMPTHYELVSSKGYDLCMLRGSPDVKRELMSRWSSSVPPKNQSLLSLDLIKRFM